MDRIDRWERDGGASRASDGQAHETVKPLDEDISHQFAEHDGKIEADRRSVESSKGREKGKATQTQQQQAH